ncbi:unnamed protein product, partial [Scytosiphon promiscuus]
TSRSQHHRGAIPRPSIGQQSKSRAKERGAHTTDVSTPAPRSRGSGGGTTARSTRSALEAGVQTSARSLGSLQSSSSSRREGGLLEQRSDSAKGGSSARRTSRSFGGDVDSLTDYSTDTPRDTARTTTTMAMSTARAEATLAMLEAERAQLEHRLKKVEDELRQEQLLSMEESRRRGRQRGAPPPIAR